MMWWKAKSTRMSIRMSATDQLSFIASGATAVPSAAMKPPLYEKPVGSEEGETLTPSLRKLGVCGLDPCIGAVEARLSSRKVIDPA
jgi:hypothetical protein